MPTYFEEYEKQARQLEQISKTLPKGSKRYLALERAAFALGFATMHHHTEFVKYVTDHKTRELSAKEIQRLESLGIKIKPAPKDGNR